MAREAFTQLSTATALRKAGRLADAITFAERARLRLGDAVRAVGELLAELRAEADRSTEPSAVIARAAG